MQLISGLRCDAPATPHKCKRRESGWVGGGAGSAGEADVGKKTVKKQGE